MIYKTIRRIYLHLETGFKEHVVNVIDAQVYFTALCRVKLSLGERKVSNRDLLNIVMFTSKYADVLCCHKFIVIGSSPLYNICISIVNFPFAHDGTCQWLRRCFNHSSSSVFFPTKSNRTIFRKEGLRFTTFIRKPTTRCCGVQHICVTGWLRLLAWTPYQQVVTIALIRHRIDPKTFHRWL